MRNPILYLLPDGRHKPIGLAGAGLGRCSREGRVTLSMKVESIMHYENIHKTL